MTDETTTWPGLRLRKKVTWALLALILCLAACARFYRLDQNGLWIDEAFTYLSITGGQVHTLVSLPENAIVSNPPPLANSAHVKPWWEILRPDTDDIHPPLYFFSLRLWTSMFGWQPTHVRAFSIFMSLIAIGCMYAVVGELSGRVAGLFAAAIMAFAQPQLDLAREARSYTMLLAIALATAWALVLIEKRGLNRPRVWGLGIGCAAMLFTHYSAFAIIITLIIYAWLRLTGTARRRTLLACLAGSLLFCVVWGPVLVWQRHGQSNLWSAIFADIAPDHYWQTFIRLLILPSRYLFEAMPGWEQVLQIMPIVLLIAVLRVRRCPGLLLWILWLPINIVPSLLTDLTSHTASLYIRRYTITASPAMYALLAVVGSGLRPSLRYMVPVVALLGCVLHFSQTYSTSGRTRQQWREMARDYQEIAKPGDLTVMITTPPRRDDYTYYLCIGTYLPGWPGPTLLMDRPPSKTLIDQLLKFRHIVVIGGSCKMLSSYLPHAKVVDFRQRVFLGQICRLNIDTISLPPSSH